MPLGLKKRTALTLHLGFERPKGCHSKVIFRNLKHKKSPKVRVARPFRGFPSSGCRFEDAFEKTYLKCEEIQRDQFLLPFFLWRRGLR